MKIMQSALQSEGSSQSWQSTTQHLAISVSITPASTPDLSALTQASISSAGLAAQQAEAMSTSSSTDVTDPRLVLLMAILEAMTGRKVQLFDGNALPQIQNQAAQTALASMPATPIRTAPNWSMQFDRSTVHEEAQTARYQAAGQVSTADGRQINFALDLTMQRYERQESSTHIAVGSRAQKLRDPLVLNLTSSQGKLEAAQFSFDLNADGKKENIATLAAGSAFLAIDKNANGQIDNGSELFGPSSGDGFQDLAKYDSDGNGWIDENDPAFSQLRVWRPGETAQTLKDANVGAIALDHAATAFTLKAGGQTAGAVRSTGVFLTEDGQAKTIQQIDLVA